MKQRQPAFTGKVPKPSLNGNDERLSALMWLSAGRNICGLSYKGAAFLFIISLFFKTVFCYSASPCILIVHAF